MTYKAFFDTNILAYEFDLNDPEKRAIARQLLAKWRPTGRMTISVQVLQELYVVLARKMGIAEEDAESIVQQYAKLPTTINKDPALVLQGIKISRKYKISFWDALIVSAAKRGSCKVLFTEDLAHGMKIEGVEIINPFKR